MEGADNPNHYCKPLQLDLVDPQISSQPPPPPPIRPGSSYHPENGKSLDSIIVIFHLTAIHRSSCCHTVSTWGLLGSPGEGLGEGPGEGPMGGAGTGSEATGWPRQPTTITTPRFTQSILLTLIPHPHSYHHWSTTPEKGCWSPQLPQSIFLTDTHTKSHDNIHTSKESIQNCHPHKLI